MFWTDDPVRDYDRYCAEQEEWLKTRPKCSQCDEPIQEEAAYKINGEWWCERCIEDSREYVPEYEGGW